MASRPASPSTKRPSPGHDPERFLADAGQTLAQHFATNGLPEGVPAEKWTALMESEGWQFGRQLRGMLREYPSMRALLPPPHHPSRTGAA
ncbi:MAG: hypothetical protein R3E96_13195 [Planctomycetota bacterium]